MRPSDASDPLVESNTDRLLLVSEVAELLRVHPTTVKKWADKGLLPCYRLGPRRDRRFRIEDVREFLLRPRSDTPRC